MGGKEENAEIDNVFRFQLNCLDHYQASPNCFDPSGLHGPPYHPTAEKDGKPNPLAQFNSDSKGNGSDEAESKRISVQKSKVPVIRVFGATETGQRVCAHIHGAFPYLYIEYRGGLGIDEVNEFKTNLHHSIDFALEMGDRKKMRDRKLSFVARITLVKGIPFYGYTVGYRFFMKIYLWNPSNILRLADLLRQGIILGTAQQPYESHLQYLLQWMCDYNLYGCDYIKCRKVVFRTPIPSYEEGNNSHHRWHDRSIPRRFLDEHAPIAKESTCALEVDICVQDILNRLDIKQRLLHHDFVERLDPILLDIKLVQSMAGLWKAEAARRRALQHNLNPGNSPFPPEAMISMSAQTRSSQKGGWMGEARYLEDVKEIAKNERIQDCDKEVSFENFVKPREGEELVQTSLQSVQDWHSGAPSPTPSGIKLRRKSVECESPVNGRKHNQANGQLPYSDADISASAEDSLLRAFELSELKGAIPFKGFHRKPDYTPKSSFSSVKTSHAPSNTLVSEDSNIPSYSTELASAGIGSPELVTLGIRRMSSQNAFELVRFEIPPQYSSRMERLMSNESSSVVGPRKRRKITFADHPASSHRSVSENQHEERDLWTSYHMPKGDDPAQKLDPKSRKVRDISRVAPPPTHYRPLLQDGGPKEIPNSFQPLKAPHSRSVKLSSPPSSETQLNGIKGENAQGNSQLPLNMVKDPDEVEEIQRLSQDCGNFKNFFGTTLKPTFHSSSSAALNQNRPRSSELSSSPFSVTPQKHLDSQISKLAKILDNHDFSTDKTIFCFGLPPPLPCLVDSTMGSHSLPSIIYQDVFYSNEEDVPERPREYAGRKLVLKSNTLPYLSDFDPSGRSLAGTVLGFNAVVGNSKEALDLTKRSQAVSWRSWEIGIPPPNRQTVNEWLSNGEPAWGQAISLQPEDPRRTLLQSQIDGPTQKSPYNYKQSQTKKPSLQRQAQYMSVMSLEVHVNTRGDLVPNPLEDEIASICWCFQSGDELTSCGSHSGILVLAPHGGPASKLSREFRMAEVEEENNELDLINKMVDIVRFHDPDILTGYEVHGGSWGYLIERAGCKYEYNLVDEFSRVKSDSKGRFGKENDRWGFNKTSTIRITGRHMINIWRSMRSELNLLQYTMETVAFHILRRRIPHYSYSSLTAWYKSDSPQQMAKVLHYFLSRAQIDLEILEENELIARTSEQARVLGVDFFSVISRGSQFKVESLMFRIAKAENFMLVSPSAKQIGGQNALECLPMVMEPASGFYNSPVLVLDFQSLYPSIIIAYNYCYSTCLGRLTSSRGENKLGFTNFRRQRRLLELLVDHITISPNGMIYVKPEIRKSLLAKMLGEILETRVMIKNGMKGANKNDKALNRLLNNRQLALKLIANVTYGYTSASFSGRMPCSEIADSIVQTGRETLEKAIALIHSVNKWGAEVVYGDTDSLFVLLKGRSKDEAFDIGNEMVKAVTNINPRPIKLKFEKVYLPCVLLAKKRYVGFKYEFKSQKEPEFDAKGIETVRRDGTPAEQKIEEYALKLLFRTADLSQIKDYFQRQCDKIMRGQVSVQDFCFAKEVKLGSYSQNGVPTPGALVSALKMREDPRAEPHYGERVPYVIVAGAPGSRLIDRCVAPETLLESNHLELDAEYYITKNIIPPLDRIFNLIGASTRAWYDEMPKVHRIRQVDPAAAAAAAAAIAAAAVTSRVGGQPDANAQRTIEFYMQAALCVACGDKIEASYKSKETVSLCKRCIRHKEIPLGSLQSRLREGQRKVLELESVCASCCGIQAWGWGSEENRCDSQDCPVFYTRTKARGKLKRDIARIEPILNFLGGKGAAPE
ncbi:MAG: DNA polymerase zeta [Trizodia sp. TS-e1964]|nr:MAG: DNA polymerase zeta [Trizodia sp. TS-e1964]